MDALKDQVSKLTQERYNYMNIYEQMQNILKQKTQLETVCNSYQVENEKLKQEVTLLRSRETSIVEISKKIQLLAAENEQLLKTRENLQTMYQ